MTIGPKWDASLASREKVAHQLKVNAQTGLSAGEAAKRLSLYGPNMLLTKVREPAWRRFLKQFADPLVYLLLGANVISVFAWSLEGMQGLPVDAIVILLIVLANATIGFMQENKAADAVAALATITASHATVVRDSRLVDIPAAEIVPGDVLSLSEGDSVGADARLISSASLQVQEASLTGESESVRKDPAVLPGAAQLGDQSNMVFKGTAVTRGVGRAVVVGTGMNTQVGKVATLLEETESAVSPLQTQISQISRTLGLVVIVIAVGVMAVLALVNGVSSTEEAVDILLMGVSLAVAAVPEGLPAILSLMLAIGVQAMARHNAVMKELDSVETLGSVTVVCSDKTGTLTKNEMTLREIVTASGRVELSGAGYEPVGDATVVTGTDDIALGETRRVLVAGGAASNAQLAEVGGTWQIQGDPTEAAILAAIPKLAGMSQDGATFVRRAEVPFDSERKLMSVLVEGAGGDFFVFSKGAPDVLLHRCSSEQVGGISVRLTTERKMELLHTIEALNGHGYRTLGVAWKTTARDNPTVFDETSERELTFGGILAIIDPPRQEATAAIVDAHSAGVETVMITGDHPVTATRIAADIGILEQDGKANVITGQDLDEMSAEQLIATSKEARVYARVSPEHKLRIVRALQANHHVVAMTGDGVNDAPALKAANIGIAMGITGTEVTKDAGQMILGDDNYATIVTAIRRGRIIFDNIQKFIRYLLSSNMGEVSTVFLGVTLSGIIGLADPVNPGSAVVPLLATQILWINLVTDSGPALAMGIDPEIDDVMCRPPRAVNARIIDRSMWARIIGIGLAMGFLNLAVLDLTLPGGLLSGLENLVPAEQQLDVARTTMFTALVFMQLFNALNSRSDTASAFSHFFTNRWLWLSLVLAAVAQVLVVQTPLLQEAFTTVSLGAEHWSLAVAAGATILLFEEAVKLVRRRFKMAAPAAGSNVD